MTTTEEASASLERVQKFDATSLPRRVELGATFAFDEAVTPANKLIAIFQRLPVSVIDELSTQHRAAIKSIADSTYSIFNQILEFDATKADATQSRKNLIQQLDASYDNVITTIMPFIAYAVSRTVDFNLLEERGRAAVQSIEDRVASVMAALQTTSDEATKILAEVRATAAEAGVSQQAMYFANEASAHDTEATKWQTYVMYWAIALGVYGIITIFLHKIPFLSPSNNPEALQLIASKVLVFFVLSYMLILAAKNYLSHRHNAVVNKHRQNALMTFNALVEAGGTAEARDVVLQHAARSIYELQETGYIRPASGAGGASSNTIVEMLPRSALRLGEQ